MEYRVRWKSINPNVSYFKLTDGVKFNGSYSVYQNIRARRAKKQKSCKIFIFKNNTCYNNINNNVSKTFLKNSI